MRSNAKPWKGFSLIELLVVIAIITILAAILFPVFARAREQTRRTACMANMHQIGVALKLYGEDNNGKYPPVLMCSPYVAGSPQTLYNGVGTPIDLHQVQNKTLVIGQKYLKDVDMFQCPDNGTNPATAVTAKNAVVYPPGTPFGGNSVPGYFYSWDSYDIGPQVDINGNPTGLMERHYSTDWTGVIGATDAKNQLKYGSAAPDTTVVTWCTYHVAIGHGDQIPVLFLNGTTRSVPIKQFIYQSASQPNGPLFVSP